MSAADIHVLDADDGHTLICTVGLPYSGKSTWARGISSRMGLPIVRPDAIRLAMHGQRFAPEAEPFVWAIAKVMVRSLFLVGHSIVILDATNTTRKRRDEWRSDEWSTVFKFIDESVDTCLRRAEGDTVIAGVIGRMSDQFESLGVEEENAWQEFTETFMDRT